MARFRFPVISADSHVVEAPRLWLDRIDSRFAHMAPRVVDLGDTHTWVVGGERMGDVDAARDEAPLTPAHKAFRDADADAKRDAEGGSTPAAYLAGLAEDGVAAAVLFPTVALGAYHAAPPGLLTAIVRVYNDWLLQEFCAESPHRLKGAAMIDVDEVDGAVAEMTRTAKNGAACWLFPVDPPSGKAYDEPSFDRVWSAAQDLGLPVVLHAQAQRSTLGSTPGDAAAKDAQLHATLTCLALSGVLGRHPGLRIGAAEWGASWMAYLADGIDHVYQSESKRGLLSIPGGGLPGDHVRRAVFLLFQDPAAIPLRARIGVDRLLWGGDISGAALATPARAASRLPELVGGVPVEEVIRFTSANAAERFGFSLARLAAPIISAPPRDRAPKSSAPRSARTSGWQANV